MQLICVTDGTRATLAFDLHPRWRIVRGDVASSGDPGSPLLAIDVPPTIERWQIGLQLLETTRFLGWTPRRTGPPVLRPVRANDGAPCEIARFVASSR